VLLSLLRRLYCLRTGHVHEQPAVPAGVGMRAVELRLRPAGPAGFPVSPALRWRLTYPTQPSPVLRAGCSGCWRRSDLDRLIGSEADLIGVNRGLLRGPCSFSHPLCPQPFAASV
jgi:hypothetical protein